MALDTACFVKEQQRATLLRFGERFAVAARVAIDRRVSERQRELELGDRAREHLVLDRTAAADRSKDRAEQPPVRRHPIQTARNLSPDRVVVADEREPGDLGALGRRNEGLRDEQVRLRRELSPSGGGRESQHCCRTRLRKARESASSTSTRGKTLYSEPSARGACCADRLAQAQRSRCCRSRSRSVDCRRNRSSENGNRRRCCRRSGR